MHQSGRKTCPMCPTGYPLECACGVGLVHKEIVDQKLSHFKCDGCGSISEIPVEIKKKRGFSS
jgi:hypothetical protein